MSTSLTHATTAVGHVLTFSSMFWIIFFLSDGLDVAIFGTRLLSKTTSFGPGPIRDHFTALLLNILLSFLLPLQHSIMARPFAVRHLGPFSRFLFTLVSFLAVAATFLLWTPLLTVLFTAPPPLARFLLCAPFAGMLLIVYSLHLLGPSFMAGPSTTTSEACPVAMTPRDLSTTSVYGLVRHPVMSGFFVIFWACDKLTEGRLVLAVVWTVYIVLAVPWLEEPDLRNAVGADVYDRYVAKVPPRYFPALSLKPRGKET